MKTLLVISVALENNCGERTKCLRIQIYMHSSFSHLESGLQCFVLGDEEGPGHPIPWDELLEGLLIILVLYEVLNYAQKVVLVAPKRSIPDKDKSHLNCLQMLRQISHGLNILCLSSQACTVLLYYGNSLGAPSLSLNELPLWFIIHHSQASDFPALTWCSSCGWRSPGIGLGQGRWPDHHSLRVPGVSCHSRCWPPRRHVPAVHPEPPPSCWPTHTWN